MNIEPLESRIAPALVTIVNATTATWLDVDGDFVTMKISKPVMASVSFDQTEVGLFATQVRTINLTDAALEGVSMTITAKPIAPSGSGPKLGDGFVNIGTISALFRHLGSISVDGDLGQIVVGNGTGTALKSLTAQSIFAFDVTTGATSFISQINGGLATLKVAGNISGYIYLPTGDLGSATVGGSLIGGDGDGSGGIYAGGTLGPVTVKGDVIGAGGASSGSIGAGGAVKAVTIGGSLLGGDGTESGRIFNGFVVFGSDMGPIKVGGDVRGGYSAAGGGEGVATGVIRSLGKLASVSIGRSLLGHAGEESGRIVANGDIGTITIGGSMIATAGGGNFFSGDIGSGGNIKSIKIGGSVMGGTPGLSGSIQGQHIGTVSIGGDLIGGGGGASGVLTAAQGFDVVTIGGSIIGGSAGDSGQVKTDNGGIGKLSVAGSIRGGSAVQSGAVITIGKIGSITVGEDVIGGGGERSGFIRASTTIGSLSIKGSLFGGFGNNSGEIIGVEALGKVTIGHDVVGGSSSNFSGTIFSPGPIGSVSIGGDLRGGLGTFGGGPSFTDNGSIQGQRIGSVTIGGSIIASPPRGVAPVRAGSIHAVEDIGSITVKGSIVGNESVPVFITASGSASPTATIDLAIKSITVGGSVSFTNILAGYDKTFMGTNGDAQIGTIKVGGDWTAGYVIASVNAVDGIVGNGNDIPLDLAVTGPTAKIAAIIIGGQVRGQPGTSNVFGFGAEEIVSMKVGGVTIPLAKGRTNDLFAGGGAHFLGSSLSTGAPDGFAVHVFEV